MRILSHFISETWEILGLWSMWQGWMPADTQGRPLHLMPREPWCSHVILPVLSLDFLFPICAFISSAISSPVSQWRSQVLAQTCPRWNSVLFSQGHTCCSFFHPGELSGWQTPKPQSPPIQLAADSGLGHPGQEATVTSPGWPTPGPG